MGAGMTSCLPRCLPGWHDFDLSHLSFGALLLLPASNPSKAMRCIPCPANNTLAFTPACPCLPCLCLLPAADVLEAEFSCDLDFGGIQTAQCGQALARATRGGLLSGSGLQAVASLLLGAAKLQRAIKAAAREAEATGSEGLQPVVDAFKASCVALWLHRLPP